MFLPWLITFQALPMLACLLPLPPPCARLATCALVQAAPFDSQARAEQPCRRWAWPPG